MNLKPIIQNEVSQKEKDKYCILTHICRRPLLLLEEPEGDGHLNPRDDILHQTVSRLPVTNQVFLGSWMVDIHQEGHSQRSGPHRRHMAHLRQRSCTAPRKPRDWDRGGDKTHSPAGRVRLPNTWSPELLRPGKAQNAGPTKSVPLRST